MINSIRTPFIINHAFRKFFVASILTSIISQINTLVNGIIVSQTVGADAISAVNLSIPIITLILAVTTMICFGTSLIMSREIGNQNYKQVDRLFTMSVSTAFIINLTLCIVLGIYSDKIAHLLTSDQRLLPLLSAYLPFSFVGTLALSLQYSLAQSIQISGQPGLVTKSMIVSSLLNVVLTSLAVIVFDTGMQGAALASAASVLLSMLIFIPYLWSENKPFRLVSLKGGWYFKMLAKSTVRGIPIAIGTAMLGIFVMGLNAIIMNSQGANGMFILSVCLQILVISMLIMTGAGSAITGVGGVLLGEQDYDGFNILIHKIFKIICGGVATFTVLMMLFPALPARMFGATGELLEISKGPIRIFSLIFIPIGIIKLLASLFMILKRGLMSSMLNMGIVVCMLPIVWLASRFAPEYIWYSIPASIWLLLLITLGTTWYISRRNKGLHWFFLTQTSSNIHWITYSVKFEKEDVEIKLNKLLSFIESYKFPRKLYLDIHHCLEELMYNEVEMASITGKHGAFDISIHNQQEKISVIIKDVGKPYNPIIKYSPNHIDDIDPSQLSMLLVNGLCENINYKYMNGLNCLYLNFEKKIR